MLTEIEPLRPEARPALVKSSRLAAIAVSLLAWTFPRVGFLKLTEAFAILAAPHALGSKRVQALMIRCYGPFLFAVLVAFGLAIFNVLGDQRHTGLSSEKAVYATPALLMTFSLVRILVYLFVVAAITHFFIYSSQERVSATLRASYYTALLPGLLQMFRLYSGVQFDLPWFEREGFGPFSGVFDAGYIRLMGFEFEPLAYASSLITVCCLSMHNGRRTPWLGLVVLAHTFGAGAIAGLLLALFISVSRRVMGMVVPLFAVVVGLVGFYVFTNIHELIEQFAFLGSVLERIAAIYNCIAMWVDHPMGAGLGSYGFFMGQYDPTGIYATEQLDVHANNDPLEFLAAGGPLLFGAYLYSFYFVLKRSRSYWLSIACISLLIQSASAYIFFNPAMTIVFSMLLARTLPVPAARRRRGRFRLVPFIRKGSKPLLHRPQESA